MPLSDSTRNLYLYFLALVCLLLIPGVSMLRIPTYLYFVSQAYLHFSSQAYLCVSSGRRFDRHFRSLLAYVFVHSLAMAMAAFSSVSQCFAIFSESGSDGFGDESRAWMEISTVRICSAGDHLSFKMSKQMRPSESMLGWYILVRKRTFGAAMGYSSGRNNSSSNIPPS